jgi:XapX domain-containing protein
MKLYLFSLGAGLLVGVIYGLLDVRSPAPPVIALVGLAGILLGEQLVPLTRHWWLHGPIDTVAVTAHLRSHSFGRLPTQAADCGLSRKTDAPHE